MTKDLNHRLDEAAKAKKAKDRAKKLKKFQKKVRHESGKAFTAEQAQILIALAEALK